MRVSSDGRRFSTVPLKARALLLNEGMCVCVRVCVARWVRAGLACILCIWGSLTSLIDDVNYVPTLSNLALVRGHPRTDCMPHCVPNSTPLPSTHKHTFTR